MIDLGGVALDAGALIAADRNDRRIWRLWKEALDRGLPLVVSTPCLAQAWRGARKARLGHLLNACEIVALDEATARRAGELCGATGSSDVVDASLAVIAASVRAAIVTADVRDLEPLASEAGGVRIIALADL